MKKAQGLSLNVIIIAALGLLVLVILAIVFTGKTGTFVKESDKCEIQGGTCVLSKDECSGQYQRIVSSAACDYNGDGKYEFGGADGWCCVSVGE